MPGFRANGRGCCWNSYCYFACTAAGTADAGTNGTTGEAASKCAIAVGRPVAAFDASTVVAEVSE